MSKEVHIIGGGTIAHIRPHFALSTPAYGSVVHLIADEVAGHAEFEGHLYTYYTKMAGNSRNHHHISITGGTTEIDSYESGLETNADIERLVESLVKDTHPKIIFFPVAMCDWEVESIEIIIDEIPVGLKPSKQLPRLSTHATTLGPPSLKLKPATKVIDQVRKERKDIFLVGFKTTVGASPQEQFDAGLTLLKKASCNLVLANDTKTLNNVIVTPEQAPYGPFDDRRIAIATLVDMALSRSQGRFTKSHVVGKDYVPWDHSMIPDSFRRVVEHCIQRGAYRPFDGKTVGHFALKRDNITFLTSMRGVDFNNLTNKHAGVGLVQVRAEGEDKVLAYGGKPSVGGQSQRIIFGAHPDMDCIVHFHCPMKAASVFKEDPSWEIPIRSQAPYECGSHECGQNTSDGLKQFVTYTPESMVPTRIKAVMLNKHGPNIVFNRTADPEAVIAFIERHWDLTRSTSEI